MPINSEAIDVFVGFPGFHNMMHNWNQWNVGSPGLASFVVHVQQVDLSDFRERLTRYLELAPYEWRAQVCVVEGMPDESQPLVPSAFVFPRVRGVFNVLDQITHGIVDELACTYIHPHVVGECVVRNSVTFDDDRRRRNVLTCKSKFGSVRMRHEEYPGRESWYNQPIAPQLIHAMMVKDPWFASMIRDWRASNDWEAGRGSSFFLLSQHCLSEDARRFCVIQGLPYHTHRPF